MIAAFNRLVPGSVLAGCEVRERVAVNDDWALYQARDVAMDLPVALKVLNPLLAHDATARARLERELRVGREAGSALLIKTYRLTEDAELLCLVGEWIESATLRSRLAQGESFSLAQVQKVAVGLLDALEALHAKGVMHRNVRPQSIVQEKSGTIRLGDYGLARVVSAMTLTCTGGPVGALPWMAPEYLLGRGYDARCDLYSVGVVLYELLTGEMPHQADAGAGLSLAITRGDILPVSVYRPGISQGWDDLVAGLLRFEPEERLTSIPMLRQLLATPEFTVVPSGGATVTCGDCGKPMSRLLPFCSYCGVSALERLESGHHSVVIEKCRNRKLLRGALESRYATALTWWGRTPLWWGRTFLAKGLSQSAAEALIEDCAFLPAGLGVDTSPWYRIELRLWDVVAVLVIGSQLTGVVDFWSAKAGFPVSTMGVSICVRLIAYVIPLVLLTRLQRLPLLSMKRLSGAPSPGAVEPGGLALARGSIMALRSDTVKRLFGRIVEQYVRLLNALTGLAVQPETRRALSRSLAATVATAGSTAEQLDKLRGYLDQTSLSVLDRELALVRAAITRTRDGDQLEQLIGREVAVSAARDSYLGARDRAEDLRNALVGLCSRLDFMIAAANAPTEIPDVEFSDWVNQLTAAAIRSVSTTAVVLPEPLSGCMPGATAGQAVGLVRSPSVLPPGDGGAEEGQDRGEACRERGVKLRSRSRRRPRTERLLRSAVVLVAIGGPLLVALELRYHFLRRRVVSQVKRYPSVTELAPGSAEALERQKRYVQEHGFAVETTNSVGMRFRLVPPGSFEAKNSGTVTVGQAYYLGRFEVTQGEWEVIMGDVPECVPMRKDCPVENVSGDDVEGFCRKLCELEGVPLSTYRLPTGHEWEYACRGGTATRFFFGDEPEALYRYGNTWDKSCFFAGGSREVHRIEWKPGKAFDDGFWRLAPVGSFRPNAWGLYDMHGNVFEYCSDIARKTRGYPSVELQMIRGGDWGSPPGSECGSGEMDYPDEYYPAGYKQRYLKGVSVAHLGFRVVYQPDELASQE